MPHANRIIDLRDYWQMIRTRMWTVLALATVVAAIAGAYVALRPPSYFAQAKVIVEPLVNPAITPVTGNSGLEPDMVIEAEKVRSLDITNAVRDDLDLVTSPQQLTKNLVVEPQRESAVLNIGYAASSPQTAMTIANAFAEQYLADRQTQIQAQVDAAIKPLQDEIDALEEDAAATDDEFELETIRDSISEYQVRIADIRAKSGSSSGGLIVQPAVEPSSPSGPGIATATILGFLLGAILGAALAIVLGLRANRVGGRDELADFIGAPVMGVIPQVEGWSSREKAELVTREEPGGPAAEAYRTLATNIRFLRSQRAVGVIVITSALPGEGKSATAANLAVVLAETGVPTLLVDADLRRPRAERFLGVANGTGLSEALRGEAALDEVVVATDVENLTMVRSGRMPDDPVAVLAGPQAGAVFHDLRRLSDIVICDAPPTLPVADASILAEVADIVLFVHDPAISSRAALEDAVHQLGTAGAEIAGGVYNNITSLQRQTLGYASYDQYYGPDERGRPKKSPSSTTKGRKPARGSVPPAGRDRSSAQPTTPNGKARSTGEVPAERDARQAQGER